MKPITRINTFSLYMLLDSYLSVSNAAYLSKDVQLADKQTFRPDFTLKWATWKKDRRIEKAKALLKTTGIKLADNLSIKKHND